MIEYLKNSYLIILKSNISDVHSHKYTKIKLNSDDDLPLQKAVNLYNEVILIKSAFIENHNHYCYHVFLEKYSYK